MYKRQFQRVGAVVDVEDQLHEDVVGHAGGPAPGDGDAHRVGPAGLHTAQQRADRDALGGAGGAQLLGGGDALVVGRLTPVEAVQHQGEQAAHVAAVLGLGQPRHIG